jgi:hypothetical protein
MNQIQKTNHIHSMKKITPIKSALAIIPLIASAFLTQPAQAGTPDPKNPVMEAPEPASWVHALFQLDFSDHYITPRGLNVENEGLVVQPLLLVFWDLYSSKTGFLENITLTTGAWSSIHSNESGADPGNWNEFDPIAGLAFKFAKYWKLETNYTAFDSMVDSYPTSHHLEVKLGFDDSSFLGKFSLHPFVAYWWELENKATVVFDPATSEESGYFTVGINPSFNIGQVKLEFPTYVNFVQDEFYQEFDGTGGGSGAAVFGTEIKATVPMKFMPKNMGSWNFYAGVKYYHLSNDGLRDGNSVLTPHEHKDDLVQFHSGFSIFF